MPAVFIIILLAGCTKSNSDCGATHTFGGVQYPYDYFSHPVDIYWGVTGGVRSYTYNWTINNVCANKNPKLTFSAGVDANNSSLSNPFSFSAATATCFGLQPQTAILNADANHIVFMSSESEIGMQQCYGGQASGNLYPYITVKFTTLGSNSADSIYLRRHLDFINVDVVGNLPK